ENDAALAEFNQALQLRPNYPDYENNLASLLKKLGRTKEAVALLERAASAEPRNGVIRGNLGTAQLAAGDIPGAIASYKQAIALTPDRASFHSDLAKAYLNSNGSVADAIGEAKAAIELDPDLADAHHNLGVALTRTGQIAPAAAEFEATIRLDPDHMD